MATYDHILFENTDMLVGVKNLKSKATGVLTTGATATANFFDQDGVAVTGAGNPISLTEVSGSKGLYRGTLPDTASLVDGDTGTVEYITDGGAGLHREWTETFVVRRNTC
jgi:hypothetical protein